MKKRLRNFAPCLVAVGGMWFVGLMFGYGVAINDFTPQGEDACLGVALASIAIMAWGIADLSEKEESDTQ